MLITRTTFTGIVERYHQPLFAFLLNLVTNRDLASDLTQDTFCDAWKAAQNGLAPFTTEHQEVEIRRWLYRVAYNKAVTTLRRQHAIRWESLDFVDLPDYAARFTSPPFENQLAEHEAVVKAMQQLSPQDIACLLLIVVQDFTAAEAAKIIGATAASVKKRIIRAKRRLLAAYTVQSEEKASL
jgi:RNA polymerase sigma-70 factor, ECF subfamily